MSDLSKPLVSTKPRAQESFVPIVRLTENSVAEGNVLERPIFKLSNKEARPTRGADKNGTPLFAKEDYTSVHDLGGGVRVVIEADVHHGYPTVFGMRVLFAIINKTRSLGFPSRRVPITRAEIASALGYAEYGGHQYRYISNAIESLHGLKIRWENAWHDVTTGSAVPSLDSEHLVTSFHFGTSAPPGQLCFAYTNEFVELGERLFQSLRAGYAIGVDLDYINRLKLPTAQRLYSYLTKKDGGKATYSESMMLLARKLPLAAIRPAAVRRILEPALRELASRQEPSGKQFLASYELEGTGQKTQLCVTFGAASMRETVKALAAQAGEAQQRGAVLGPRARART